MKPMLPSLIFTPPSHGKWLYEIKYDGFRGILKWDQHEWSLLSRNGKDLLLQFPEIKSFLIQYQEAANPFFPLILDGEIVILENNWKANFSQLQIRGRMKTQEKIAEASEKRPCRFLVFDLLMARGQSTLLTSYIKRKEMLQSIFSSLHLPTAPSIDRTEIIQLLHPYNNFSEIQALVKDFDSEGIVAKEASSFWEEGKRTSHWLKLKNWKTVSCYITGYDKANGFFYIGIYKNNQIFPLGSFINGIDHSTKNTLKIVIQNNFTSKQGSLLRMEPAICLDIYFLEWHGSDQLREPYFKELRLDLTPDKCSYENFLINEAALPLEINITHPEKILWSRNHVMKAEFLRYLRKISPYLLPFLRDRLLTVIRAPHGEFGEYFYQKNKPETAPAFVHSFQHDSNNMIVCNDLKTLIWLGNQLAIEYHIPFQTVKSKYVSEIVLDLDPPSREEFHLAVQAALIIKQVLDQLELISFVKFSGNKGMQVYIPLEDDRYTWEQTRLFTEFIARFLISYDPNSFTIERLKKNRHGRLYVDFIQHAEGKTIIAPYSVRTSSKGLVAAPLLWEEIHEELNPELFTIDYVLKRIDQHGDPFTMFFASKKNQPFDQVLDMIQHDKLH